MPRPSSALLVIVLLLFQAVGAFADSDCVKALSTELKTKIFYSSTNSSELDITKRFCSADFEKSFRNTNGGLSAIVPISGIPVQFGGSLDSQANWERRASLCKDSHFALSEAAQSYIVTEYATPDQFKSFVACKALEESHSPVKMRMTSAGENISILFDYSKIGDDMPAAAKIDSFSAIGASCPSPIVKGNRIPSGGVSSVCTRTGDAPVVLTLNTRLGTQTLTLPARRQGYAVGTWTLQSNEVALVAAQYGFPQLGRGMRGEERQPMSQTYKVSSITDAPGARFRLFYNSVGQAFKCDPSSIDDSHGCDFVHVYSVRLSESGTIINLEAEKIGGPQCVFTVIADVIKPVPPTTGILKVGQLFTVEYDETQGASLKINSSDIGTYDITMQQPYSDPHGVITMAGINHLPNNRVRVTFMTNDVEASTMAMAN